MVETHKRKRKNTVITKIALTISNAEHIKQTLSTNKHYRHQQHCDNRTRTDRPDRTTTEQHHYSTAQLHDENTCHTRELELLKSSADATTPLIGPDRSAPAIDVTTPH